MKKKIKQRMRIDKIVDKFADSGFYLYTHCSLSDCIDDVRKNIVHVEDDFLDKLGGVRGVFFSRKGEEEGTLANIMWIKDVDNNFSTVLHELIHYIFFIEDFTGIEIGIDNDEVFAKHYQYIYKEIMDKLNFSKKK